MVGPVTDHGQVPLLRRADAVQQGCSDAEPARLVRRGEVLRLQRGTCTSMPEAVPAEAAAGHRPVVTAARACGCTSPGSPEKRRR